MIKSFIDILIESMEDMAGDDDSAREVGLDDETGHYANKMSRKTEDEDDEDEDEEDEEEIDEDGKPFLVKKSDREKMRSGKPKSKEQERDEMYDHVAKKWGMKKSKKCSEDMDDKDEGQGISVAKKNQTSSQKINKRY